MLDAKARPDGSGGEVWEPAQRPREVSIDDAMEHDGSVAAVPGGAPVIPMENRRRENIDAFYRSAVMPTRPLGSRADLAVAPVTGSRPAGEAR